MQDMLSLFVLAFAVSLDGFGVGLTYGFRKIRIPLISIVIIAICSAVVILTSMQMGKGIEAWLPAEAGRYLGSFIFIAIGIWAIYNISRNKESTPEGTNQEPSSEKLFSIEIKTLGLVIQILKTPTMADIDRSGSISAAEATLLGFALSLDAFGAGIGAALIGLNPWMTALVIAVMCMVFVILGLQIGFKYAHVWVMRRFSYLPGLLLILMGVMKMI